MPASPFGSPAVSLTSSSRSSQKSYSARRFQAHREKRKAEREAESSDTDGASDGGARIGMLPATTKRARRNSGSPSPIKRKQQDEVSPDTSMGGEESNAKKQSGGVVKVGQRSTRIDIIEAGPARPSVRRTRSAGRSRLGTPEPGDGINPAADNSRTTPAAPRTPTRPTTTRALSAHSSPRDLSALFEVRDGDGRDSPRAPASPSGKLVRPGGMRRMLTKAQSLGDALGSPTKSVHSSTFSNQADSGPSTPSRHLNRTMSMPSSPFSPSGDSPRADEAPVRPGLAVRQSDSGAGGRKAKRTYGRSRTFLEETQGAESGLAVLTDQDAEERQSYAELRHKYEVDNADAGGPSAGMLAELQQARPPQPISDMRSKGENRRFLDEVGYLVAGLQDPLANLALRRSSSLDVLRSMEDEQWAQKVHVCGQSEAIWEGLMSARKNGDDVIECIAVLYLVICASSPIGLEAILQGHAGEVFDHLQRGIMRPGFMQNAFTANKKLSTIATTIPVQWGIEIPTARRYASWLLTQVLDDRYISVVPAALTTSILSAAASASDQEVRIVASRFDLHQKGLPLVRDEDDFDPEHLSLCLEAISSVIRRDEGELQLFAGQRYALASTLSDSVTIALDSLKTKVGRAREIAADTLLEAVQIQVVFSKLSNTWAAQCLSSIEDLHSIAATIIQRDHMASALAEPSPEPDQSAFLDKPSQASRVTSTSEEVLCLILSLIVTALPANKKKVSDWLAAIEIGPDCPATGGCLRTCRCKDKAPFYVHLAGVYGLYKGDDTETGPVIRGYLALLLARALLSHPDGSERVRQRWECDNQEEVSGELVRALEALQALHRQAGQAGQPSDEEDEGDSDRIVSDTLEELRAV